MRSKIASAAVWLCVSLAFLSGVGLRPNVWANRSPKPKNAQSHSLPVTGKSNVPSERPTPCTPRILQTQANGEVVAVEPTHMFTGAYYRVAENLRTTLLLNNKSPRPLVVQPTLFSLAGQRLDSAPVTIDAQSFRIVTLQQLGAVLGSPFAEGSLQLTFQGKNLVLGAQIEMTDDARSLLFFERLSDACVALNSNRIEGIWQALNPFSAVRLAVSNTTDAPVTATVAVDDVNRAALPGVTLDLAPRETRLLDLRRDILGRRILPRQGGIIVTHTGVPGAVRAHGQVENAEFGYSSVITFANLLAQKTQRLDANGLRLSADDEPLTPLVTIHNFGVDPTVVTGLDYTLNVGGRGTLTLPEVRLQPGETRTVAPSIPGNVRRNVAAAGMEFSYATTPGSVSIVTQTVSRNGNQVFRVPMLDPETIPSGTGSYPWRVTETLGTFVYLKNATDHELEYHASLNFPGGQYALGRAKIAAHETVAIDLRALRDAQRPDAVGNLIPPDAQAGQFLWSIHGTETKSIIGRAEQADFINGFSSSYACFNCCPDSFGNGWISGSVFSFAVGGSGLFNAFESYQNCYGGTTGTWRVSNAAWAVGPAFLGSFAPSFQSVQFTAATPGNGLLEATWPVFHRDTICEAVFENFTAAEPMEVVGLRILMNGEDVTNTTRNAIVGQKISLTVESSPPGKPVSSPRWTVPGNPIANWDVSYPGPDQPSTASVIALTNTNSSSINFYWVEGGDGRQVQVTATVNGQPMTVRVTFNVKRPVATVLVTTSKITVSTFNGVLGINFGIGAFPKSTPGIIFQRQAFSIPSGFTGETSWVQVVDQLKRNIEGNNGQRIQLFSSGLDRTLPYEQNPEIADDFPGQGLSDIQKKVETDDKYTMWLMFKPSGADSIMVPLRSVSWGWSATVTRSGPMMWNIVASNIQTPLRKSPPLTPRGLETLHRQHLNHSIEPGKSRSNLHMKTLSFATFFAMILISLFLR